MKKNRQGAIGGSDVARIMDGDWYTLYLEKIGDKEPDDLTDVLAVQLGVHTESFNLNWFQKHCTELKNKKIIREPSALCTIDGAYDLVPFLCHLDGVTESNCTIIECKHTHQMNKMSNVIERYMPQIQTYMYCSGIKDTYLSVIFGNHRYEYIKVKYNKEYFDKVMVHVKEFWNCVLNKDAPVHPNVHKPSTDSIHIDDKVVRNMNNDNYFINNAHDYVNTLHEAKINASAKKILLDNVTDTDRELKCDLLSVNISKTGRRSISITDMKILTEQTQKYINN